MILDDVIQTYCQAWCEPDPAGRLALLETAWAEKGSYQDPSADVSGHAALCAHIGDLHSKVPGVRIELTSAVSHHHGNVYFGWRMVTADGTVGAEGVDFGTLAKDGRISRIVGFFGPPGS